MTDPTTSLRHSGPRRYASIPAHERLVEQLADLLLAADEVLETLRAEDAAKFGWAEPDVQKVYDTTNELMKRLTD